ncbi:BtrH N-terminal domain-containing protein [Mycolicibacterium sp. 141076]|uniref:BtrH N-terminal domain-containing protein n=1 Tax=Mycolicibacterium sp. 141076 TaxID=3090599 RepID=UPI00299D169E|nr:BtrH N-terminal domain-containing protein [Mycolicibacterium sp. 141076]MDX1881105.1 BtrH N-terminal domain-containing protein [Mycolicibacterium sp. 141076]
MATVILPYRHEVAGHCGSGALRDLTEWAGIRFAGHVPDEGLVFVLGGALDFSYIRSAKLQPPVYLVGRSADLEDEYLNRLGAQFETRATDDADLGWKWVTEQLDAGTPVMVWTDIAELPYLRARLNMSRHDVVVVGYDDAQEVAYVVDNDRDTVQAVPYANLRRARASTGFPVPTRNTTYIVEWPESAPDLRVAACSAFLRSAEAMEGAYIGAPIASLSSSEMQVSGLAGISSFVEDLNRWPDLFDDDCLEAALFALSALIQKAGTGGGLFRSLQAQGCQKVAELLDFEPAQEAADAAAAASRLWTGLASIAYDPEADPRRRAADAASLAAQLPSAEWELATALRAAGNSLRGRRITSV